MSERVDEYRFFREATLRICGSLQVQEAIDAFRLYAQDFIPFDEVNVAFYDEFSSSGIVLAISSSTEVSPHAPTARYTRDEWIQFREALLRDGTTTIINDFEKADEIYRLVNRLHKADDSDKSLLRLTLMMNSKEIGIVMLNSHKKQTFQESHAHLLGLLHAPFAVAMANWRQHLTLMRYQQTLQDDCQFYQEALRREAGNTVIGATKGLHGVMEMAGRVAVTDSPVMILGETGVGKEVVANAIHNASDRKNGPFIKVNCGAIPENLIDSELFGHEKGAFTGANKSHRGRFERASGGTLFLDEVGELPLQAQVRLLRVLQTQEVERVGSSESVPVDVRVISATHRDLASMVAAGTFRQDLWFRLNVFPITIPPLRERTMDIPDLAHYFVVEKLKELKRHIPQEISDVAIQRLVNYPWPGNVRELQNVVERELILNSDEVLHFDSLLPIPVPQVAQAHSQVSVEPLDTVISRAIEDALKTADGKVQGKGGAAELLGINPNTLRARMRKLGIQYGRQKTP